MVNKDRHQHFILQGKISSESFSRPKQSMTTQPVPQRDRQTHGQLLLSQIDELKSQMVLARQSQEEAGLEGEFGLQVEFESFPDIDLAFESLARESSGIELLNFRHGEHQTYATIFVPDGKLKHFEKLLQDYLADKKGSKDKSLDHKKLINTISSIRSASLRALWTDDPAAFPQNEAEVFWWEVWLPIRKDRSATVATFRRLAECRNLRWLPARWNFLSGQYCLYERPQQAWLDP